MSIFSADGASVSGGKWVLMAPPANVRVYQAALLSRPWHLLVSRGSAELLFCTQQDLVLVMRKADVQECPQPDTALAVPAPNYRA